MVYFNREKMKFTEEKLEKAFIELLRNENYSPLSGYLEVPSWYFKLKKSN